MSCLYHVLTCIFSDYCGSSWLRSRHRKDMERWPEHMRDKMDVGEDGKDQARQKNEHWRRRDALEMRCCYLCGSSAHIKKDCQLYRSPAGSSKVFFLAEEQLAVLITRYPFLCLKTTKLPNISGKKYSFASFNLELSFGR